MGKKREFNIVNIIQDKYYLDWVKSLEEKYLIPSRTRDFYDDPLNVLYMQINFGLLIHVQIILHHSVISWFKIFQPDNAVWIVFSIHQQVNLLLVIIIVIVVIIVKPQYLWKMPRRNHRHTKPNHGRKYVMHFFSSESRPASRL